MGCVGVLHRFSRENPKPSTQLFTNDISKGLCKVPFAILIQAVYDHHVSHHCSPDLMDMGSLLGTILNYARGPHVHCEGSSRKANIDSSSFQGQRIRASHAV